MTPTFAMTIASGSISVVSRFVGADDQRNPSFTVKQALFLVVLFSLPVIYASWHNADAAIAC